MIGRFCLILLAMWGLAEARLAGQDCVPLTYTTLSHLAGRDRSYTAWMADLMQHGVPDLETAIVGWFVEQPLIDLRPIDTHCWTTVLKPGRPYVLICQMPLSEVGLDISGNCHCCLVYFRQDGNAVLVHTLIVRGAFTEFATQQLSRAEFDERLLFLFEVVPASPLVIRWKQLTD